MKFKKFFSDFMQHNKITNQEMADKLGVSTAFVSYLKTGKRIPTKKMVDKLTQAFVTLENKKLELYTYIEEDEKEEILKKIGVSNGRITLKKHFARIPIYGKASAGETGYYNMDNIIKELDVVLPSEYDNENIIGIEVSGDSMENKLLDGDIALVDVTKTSFNDVQHKMILVALREDTFIKTFEFNKKLNIVFLKSCNPKYEDIIVYDEDINNFECKGLIIGRQSFF